MHLNSQSWGLIFWLVLKHTKEINKSILALFSKENHTEVSVSTQYRIPQLRCCTSMANASKWDLWPAGRWLLREKKMDCETFVKDCLKAQWKKDDLWREETLQRKSTFPQKDTCWENVGLKFKRKYLVEKCYKSSVWNVWSCCGSASCQAVSGEGRGLCLVKSMWSSL